MTTFTPGPWSIDETGYRTEGNGVCIMAWPNCVAIVGMHNPELPNNANARLIAAAPELLEALEACTRWMEMLRDSGDAGFWDWGKGSEYVAGLAALGKARGSQ